MKRFYVSYNIGHAKYVINYHDGISTHNDGSPFFGILIFSNKKHLEAKIKEIKSIGYRHDPYYM